MSNDNPTMLDISSYTTIPPALAKRILNYYDNLREARKGAALCYTLAQLIRLRLLIEHTASVDFDSATIDDGLDELGHMLHLSIEV